MGYGPPRCTRNNILSFPSWEMPSEARLFFRRISSEILLLGLIANIALGLPNNYFMVIPKIIKKIRSIPKQTSYTQYFLYSVCWHWKLQNRKSSLCNIPQIFSSFVCALVCTNSLHLALCFTDFLIVPLLVLRGDRVIAIHSRRLLYGCRIRDLA